MSQRSHYHQQLLVAIMAIQRQVVSIEEILPVLKELALDPTKSLSALLGESIPSTPEQSNSIVIDAYKDLTQNFGLSVEPNQLSLLASIDQLREALDGEQDLRQSLEEIREEILIQSKSTEVASPQVILDSTSRKIGNYKLLQKLGEGGMGEVWMAEQENPVRRMVALKLIKPGLDNRQVVARFEAERQALAIMHHPNIAQVLDAGTTQSGTPYFVMELVRGIPFTNYCDQNKLSIDERLRLFIPVCQAVQHAHQKGIIHRDLKPSNVLVSLHDGKPVPK